MKYCGVLTPFIGVTTYVCSVMGISGSETALEELLSSVLDDLLQEGIVTKLSDDLYCGGNSHEELLNNWESIHRFSAIWYIPLSVKNYCRPPNNDHSGMDMK